MLHREDHLLSLKLGFHLSEHYIFSEREKERYENRMRVLAIFYNSLSLIFLVILWAPLPDDYTKEHRAIDEK